MRHFIIGLGLVITFVLEAFPPYSQANNSLALSPTVETFPVAFGKQLLVSISSDWSSSQATLYGFSRLNEQSPWQLRFTYPAVLGRKGMGWGLGLHGWSQGPGPVKTEGDLRSPAGIFLLPSLFGYASKEESGVTDFPYVQLTSDTLAVDDPRSSFYNRLVERSKEKSSQWKSAETMLRPDGAYRLGVWVSHNDPSVKGVPAPFPQGPVPGKMPLGSCIFIHIWRSPQKPTVGCTAISPQNMESLVRWLRSEDRPLLIQLPLGEYRNFQSSWKLPNLPARP